MPTHTVNRKQRWGTILPNYNFKMDFLPSKKAKSHGLSRLKPKLCELLEDEVITALIAENEIKKVLCNMWSTSDAGWN